MANLQKITPFLWFDQQAEAAANFYTSVLGNSKIGNVLRNGEAVMVVDFWLDGQKFTPLLMFSGAQQGRAEEALGFYTSLFDGASVNGILRYGAGETGPMGQITHAQFQLCGQTFMLMDSGIEQDFTFNEALSLVVSCDTQEEVDFSGKN